MKKAGLGGGAAKEGAGSSGSGGGGGWGGSVVGGGMLGANNTVCQGSFRAASAKTCLVEGRVLVLQHL